MTRDQCQVTKCTQNTATTPPRQPAAGGGTVSYLSGRQDYGGDLRTVAPLGQERQRERLEEDARDEGEHAAPARHAALHVQRVLSALWGGGGRVKRGNGCRGQGRDMRIAQPQVKKTDWPCVLEAPNDVGPTEATRYCQGIQWQRN